MMNRLIYFFGLLTMVGFYACIGDDYVQDLVDPELRITSSIDTLGLDESFQLEYMYLNNIGLEEEVVVDWTSSNPDVIEVSSSGIITALMTGDAVIIKATLQKDGILFEDSISVVVGDMTVGGLQSTSGVVETTSSYKLSGDFVFEETQTGVKLSLGSNYTASTSLPGLYVYLSNNANSVSNAFEIAKVEVFDGAHEYDIDGIGFSEYKYILYFCKPFNVKVGDGSL